MLFSVTKQNISPQCKRITYHSIIRHILWHFYRLHLDDGQFDICGQREENIIDYRVNFIVE